MYEYFGIQLLLFFDIIKSISQVTQQNKNSTIKSDA